jgi:type II secretory pathway predicted ATPase ExeA
MKLGIFKLRHRLQVSHLEKNKSYAKPVPFDYAIVLVRSKTQGIPAINNNTFLSISVETKYSAMNSTKRL